MVLVKGFLESYSLGTSRCSSLAGVAKKRVIHNITKSLLNRFRTCLVIVTKSSKTFSSSPNRAIFVWSWNEKAQTKQKQQMNGNRVLWLSNGYKWSKRSAEQTLRWKNFIPKELSRNESILCFDIILQHDCPIELVLSPHYGFLWLENQESMFWSIHPLADKTNNKQLPKPFFKVIQKSL